MAGPFWFAWVAEGTEFDGETHAVEDEDVFGFEISHTEGEAPTLALDVVNPRIGLLNASREQWAWFSYGEGSSVAPLFYGRLIGIPQELQNEVVRLEFRAMPVDYEAQKAALAETLKVAPYWDPVWITEEARLDPDSVLESRTQLWHVDRLTHEVTVSDIITGEAATIDFGSDYFYDSLSVSYTSPPGKVCNVRATAVWEQQATGSIDITSEFPPFIETLTGDGLIEDWPKAGASIGGGWTFESADWRPYYGFSVTDQFAGTSARSFSTATGDVISWAPARIVPFNMVVAYEAEREYAETLTFSLQADVQALLTDAGDDEVLTIDVSAEVDQAIDPEEASGEGPLMPIRDLKSRRYFQSERGRESLDYLICLARAQLVHRARAVEIAFEVPFDDGVDLSCRHMATIADDRIPGGTVTAKVKGYALSLNGDTGAATCRVTIGAAIGNGGTVSEVAGTPSYVATGYVNAGYQFFDGQTTAVVADEVTVEDYSDLPINDDGVDWSALTAASVIEAITIYNDSAEQIDIFDSEVGGIGGTGVAEDQYHVMQIFTEAYTEVELDLISAKGGPFETELPVVPSLLKIPKQLDLTAAAA
jgi:hypothetical protein